MVAAEANSAAEEAEKAAALAKDEAADALRVADALKANCRLAVQRAKEAVKEAKRAHAQFLKDSKRARRLAQQAAEMRADTATAWNVALTAVVQAIKKS